MSQLIGHSRRAFMGLALATAAAVSARDTSSIGRPTSHPARPARDFADAVGLCTHPSWRDTVWGSSDWPAALLATSVRHVRARIGKSAAGRAGLNDLRPFLAGGGRMCALVTGNEQTFDLPRISESIDFLAEHVGAAGLSAIEGPNEYNNPSRRPADWVPRLRSFVRWLHERVRSDPRLAGVPLVAPSIWGRLPGDYRQVGDLRPNVDHGNLHYYTGGRRPSLSGVATLSNELGIARDYPLGEALRDAELLAPGKPVWITEFGFPVAGPGQPLSRQTISERAAAKYLLRGLFDAYGQGAERIFIYSLLDDDRDPPRYHGLMDRSLRPRPSYGALRNLMGLVRSASEPRIGQATLAYAVTAVPALREQLFHLGGREFLLILYRDIDSFDRLILRDISTPPLPVLVTLAAPARSIETFAPTFASMPLSRQTDVQSIRVPVADEVIAIRISV